MRTLTSATLLLALTPLLAQATDYPIQSPADLTAAAPKLKPGDSLILKDGAYTDQKFTLTATGTSDHPITFRPEHPGKAILTGNSSITADGAYLVISGIYVKDFGPAEGTDDKGARDGLTLLAHHSRLTDSAFENGRTHFMVHLVGTDNRMDHCYLAGKTSGDPTFQIEVPFDRPSNAHVDHNHFGHRAPLGRNGGETIRVGYSGQSMNSGRVLIEDNLFDRCDGEIEIISSKSCDNVYRHNTFLDCAGMLTLRHGNRCVVDANFFLAHHKKDSGGIRVIGEDHTLTNNYIDGVDKGAFWITSGVPNSKLIQYICARRTTIANNTVVDSAGPYLDLAAGINGSGRKIKPDQLTIANNLFQLGKGGTLIANADNEGQYNTWLNNLVAPAENLPTHEGLKAEDLKLEKGKDGLWRPTKESPAIHAAAPIPLQLDAKQAPTYIQYAKVQHDIDGQERPENNKSIGCDEPSDAPATNHPLTAQEVGPAWLPRTAGEPR